MPRLNSSRVILGGLAAGLVMNIIDAITNGFLLGARWKVETEALNPGLMGYYSWSLVGASSVGGLMAALAGGYVGARLYREAA